VRYWNASQITRLCRAILKGPERTKYRDMTTREWSEFKSYLVSRYLGKLEQGGVVFPVSVADRVSKLIQRFPYSAPLDHSDEFLMYSGGVRNVSWDEKIVPSEFSYFALVTATERVAKWNSQHSLMMRKLASEDHISTLQTLEKAIETELVDASFWSEAFSGLASNPALAKQRINNVPTVIGDEEASSIIPSDFLDRLLNVLAKLPNPCLQNRKVAHAIVDFWRTSPVAFLPSDRYLEIWDRLWIAFAQFPTETPERSDAVGYAINDPAGKLTKELLDYLWPKDAKVGGGIPRVLSDRLEKIVRRTSHQVLDASSVIVASRADVLHAVAPEFAIKSVMPLLSWNDNASAAAYWTAFLWPARISPDLFRLLEADCLTALKNASRFDANSFKILCQIFVLASMEFRAIAENTVKDILGQIGELGLAHMADRSRMLNSKKDAETYWLQTVKPWIKTHWPRDAAKQNEQTMEDFAMIALYSKASFPKALYWLEDNGLLGEVPKASRILYSLKTRDEQTHEDFDVTSTLPERFPKEVLHLLWLTRPFLWDHGIKKEILDRLNAVDPDLASSAEYKMLI
jgi:hypothetical protein